MIYASKGAPKQKRTLPIIAALLAGFTVIGLIGFLIYINVKSTPTVEEIISNSVSFDASVSESEKSAILSAIASQQIELTAPVTASVYTSAVITNTDLVLNAYVPATNIYSVRQKVTTAELTGLQVNILKDDDAAARAVLGALGSTGVPVSIAQDDLSEIPETDLLFMPVTDLTPAIKLLQLDGEYYLDTFTSGALFREVVFSGEGTDALTSLNANKLPGKEEVFKVNLTGVTALTRIMMRKLAAVQDPLYFSANIGDFLADADLTHVSNEVSFIPGCSYSDTSFCSPPEFIETLKASGVDLVELTGNHNNDQGSIYNTQSIELYKSLGWGTVGGGLNNVEAAKPYISNAKGSSVAFLAYNYPDSPNGGAISGADSAGANSFDFDRIATEIATAKETSDFAVVNVQYWECYAYPDGYVEYPVCDKPIGEQEVVFKKLVDLGADMVVGSSAHQPQTYEMYNGKPIYYGLGNLYFDQTQWPGTERGIVLSNYFSGGKLLQTKLTPTVYGTDLQTRIMTDAESDYLLTRLHDARD